MHVNREHYSIIRYSWKEAGSRWVMCVGERHQNLWNPWSSEPALQLCSLRSAWLCWVTELHHLSRSGTQAVLGRKAPLSLPSHNATKVQSKLTCGSFLTTWNSLDLSGSWVSNLNWNRTVALLWWFYKLWFPRLHLLLFLII